MGIFVFKGKYDFLDMYYPCIIELDGVKYDNAMSAFAACRLQSIKFREDCATNEDREYFKYLITNLRNSNLNSLMVSNFNEYDSLYRILKIKFSYKDLEEKLKSTNEEKIIYLNKF